LIASDELAADSKSFKRRRSFSKVEEMARHVFASWHVTSLLAGVFQN
jgi:hypothetical protein